jgi:hypothetical protein
MGPARGLILSIRRTEHSETISESFDILNSRLGIGRIRRFAESECPGLEIGDLISILTP